MALKSFMRCGVVLLALAAAACTEEPAAPEAPAVTLTPGWTVQVNGFGNSEAYWAGDDGKPVFAFLCGREVPELIVQAMGGQPAAPYAMSLWADDRQWSLTATEGDGAFVEGRLPLAEGVRTNLLGAGDIRIEASNWTGEPRVLDNAEAFRDVIANCHQAAGLGAPGDLPAAVTETPARVTVAADPAPPFTYWAPEGSTIRNYNNPGQWMAELDGKQVATYFGDDCLASRLQNLVGQTVDAIPLDGRSEWRVFEKNAPVTQDLRLNRVNVKFDGETRRIVEVACY